MMKNRHCKRVGRLSHRRNRLGTNQAASGSQLEHDEQNARARLNTAAFQHELDVDADPNSALTIGTAQCGTEWSHHIREELATDGRKRQSLLDSLGQVTVADLLDGA